MTAASGAAQVGSSEAVLAKEAAMMLLSHTKKVSARKPPSAPRFEELDALRGFCTCIVVTGHFWFAFGDRVHIPGLINASVMSLDVFFVMSGFLIAYSYLLDGKVKSLLSSAFRRYPRLLIPALCANVLSWIFSELGSFHAQGQWRKLSVNGQWCPTCFSTAAPPELTFSYAVLSAKNLISSFGVGSYSFPWQWTIPQELYGSTVVFMLAPFFRILVNYRAAEVDELGPLQLKRVFVVSVFLLGALLAASKGIEYWMLSLAAPPLPDGSSGDKMMDALVAMLQSKTRTGFLFASGLILAQCSIIVRANLPGEHSWADRTRTRWREMHTTKWVMPLCLIIIPILCPALIECLDDSVLCPQPAHWSEFMKPVLLLVAPLSVMTGVLLSPAELRSMMGNSVFHFLGRISFSIYLVHLIVIFSVGTALYVWLDHSLGPLATLTSIMVLTAVPMLLLSYSFWLVVEDPLGMRLPRKTFALIWQELDKAQNYAGGQRLPLLIQDQLRSILGKPC